MLKRHNLNLFRHAAFWQKLFSVAAIVIVTSAFTVAVIGYTQAKVAVLRQARRQVLSIARERKSRIETWMEGRARSAEASAASHEVLVALTYAERGDRRARPYGEIAIAQSERRQHHDKAIRTVALYDEKDQLVAFLGDSLEAEAMRRAPETRKALKGESVFGDIHLNRHGVPVINLATHVHATNGDVIGAYVYQYATKNTLDAIVMDTTGLDAGGESYLVDRHAVMLTSSRLRNHPDPLKHTMDIPPVEHALRGETGVMEYPGFLGGRVVGGYTYMPEQKWAVITEMNLKDAYQPLELFLQRTSLATMVALLVMLGLALLLTRIWTDPLQRVIDASQQVAAGRFDVHVPETARQDEMAVLSRVFNNMVDSVVRSRERLKQSQEKLMQAEKMAEIGTLLASVVHEMRNPLSSIKVNLQLLSRKLEAESMVHGIVADSEEDVLRLENMLSGLLEYSRPPSAETTTVSCEAIANEAVARLASSAADRQIRLELENELPGEVSIASDPEALLQSLVNLLSNALQASEAEQEVVLKLEKSKQAVRFTVFDHGRGMSEFVQKRLFEPFFTTRDDGVGLGMSNVKKYVEHLGGKIHVTSMEGVGTSITLELPVGDD